MLNVHEVMAGLDGNGYEQKEILEISNELTQFAIMKERVFTTLKAVYDQDELEEMLGNIKAPTRQEQILSKSLKSFASREKQCYIMHTVDSKSMGKIAIELNVSKGAVQQYIERARKKIELSLNEK